MVQPLSLTISFLLVKMKGYRYWRSAKSPSFSISLFVCGPQTFMHGFYSLDSIRGAFYIEQVLINEHFFCSINIGLQV